jgi:hypothetical protein
MGFRSCLSTASSEVFLGKSAWRLAQLSPAPIVRSVEALLSSASTLYPRIQAFKGNQLGTASSLACILTNVKSEADGDTEPLITTAYHEK